jgi:hypothetical protein
MGWVDVYERRLFTDVEEDGLCLDRLREIEELSVRTTNTLEKMGADTF